MGWTKRQLVAQAFEEIGLAAYVYDLTPDQIQSALRRMDAMVAGWNSNGVRIGYSLPSNPDDSDPDVDSGVPDFANEALFLGLAVRLAPSYGKQVAAETKAWADAAYSNMVNQVAVPTPERQTPNTLPRGQGSKPWRTVNQPFMRTPEDPVDAGGDGPIIYE
jgi:hypothetical protein